jgi:hypothetical protein
MKRQKTSEATTFMVRIHVGQQGAQTILFVADGAQMLMAARAGQQIRRGDT